MQKLINSEFHFRNKVLQIQNFIPKTKAQVSTYIETLNIKTKVQDSTYIETLIPKAKGQFRQISFQNPDAKLTNLYLYSTNKSS
jgi:glycine cleavage system pyridoxal-binding protein P